jgi:hypothetical protein
MWRGKARINKIRNEKSGDNNKHQGKPRIFMDYFENLYLNKLENLEEMDKFLDKYAIQN